MVWEVVREPMFLLLPFHLSKTMLHTRYQQMVRPGKQLPFPLANLDGLPGHIAAI